MLNKSWPMMFFYLQHKIQYP